MARKRRQWNPKMYDHVVMRGNNRQDIFRNPEDIVEFFRVLHYTYDKHRFIIIAYCIMTNHYHLLIRSPEVPLGKVMAHINRRYTEYYKKKYNYSGYLYDSRYFAKMVTSPKGLLAVSRYIHRNPIETKKTLVDRMEHYPHSSYSLYYNHLPASHPFLNVDLLPEILKEYKSISYCKYCESNEEEISISEVISVIDTI